MATGYIPAELERAGNCGRVKTENRAFLGGVLGVDVNGERQPISEGGIVDLTFIEEDTREAAEQAIASAAAAAESKQTASEAAAAALSSEIAARTAASAAEAAKDDAEDAASTSNASKNTAAAHASAAQTAAATAQIAQGNADRSSESAIAAAAQAASSAGSALRSANDAYTSASAAQDASDAAQTAQAAAEASEATASTAASTATAAKDAAQAAKTAAETAQSAATASASAASNSETAAAASATSASNSETAAAASATSASGSATAAAASATAADASADAADASETAAAGSATAAAASAESAAQSATEAAAFVGSPLKAGTLAEMTNTNKVYVYTGEEVGMTAGHWYYYDGEYWADGGVYNGVATDDTMTEAGVAADAKAVGDALLDKAAVVVDTASGAIASFPDGSAAPIKQLTVGIEPVQDLHGYDNPWPAGGGKNKLPLKFYGGVGYNVDAGTVFDTATEYTDGVVSGNKITFAVGGWGRRCMLSDRLVSGESYYISMEVTSANLRFTWYTLDADLKTVRKYEVTGSGTSKTVRNPVTMAENECYIAIYLGSSTQGDISFTEPQIEVGNAKTAYAPYSNECPITGWTGADVTVSPTLDAQDGQTYPITFPSEAGTVYGGTVTVEQDGTGTLLDDHALWLPANLSTAGAIAETINGYPCVSIVIAALKSYETRADIKCSHFPFLGNTAADVKPYGIVNRTASYYNVAFCAPDLFTTVAEFSAWVTTNNCTLFAPRATPQTYTLTAPQMQTLLGANNWWADTGDVSVNYRCDTKLYIDKKLAALLAALS